MYQALPPAFLHEFKGHAIIARKGGEPGNEARLKRSQLAIRKYGSTFYIGIAMVVLPYFGPWEN